MFSCQKENDDIDMIVGSAKNELPFTTSAKARFYGNDFLNQLNAIPVYIFYEEGAVAPTKKYLSCSPRDSYELTVADRDDGSGRQRWLISKYTSGYQSEWGIEVQGGYSSGRKYLSDYPLPPNAGIDPFPCMHNQQIFSHGYWNFEFYNMKWYIWRNGKPLYYIYNASFNGANFKYLTSNPYDNLGAGFFIYPVEEFSLSSVDYSILDNQTYVDPEIVYLTSRTLVNDTPYEAERTIQVTENYEYSSNFSQTEGLSISETITVGAGFNVSVPIINVGINGKIETTRRTDHNYTFTTGKNEKYSFTFNQTITQLMPPKTTIRALLVAKKYVFNTQYTGNFVNKSKSKQILLNGIWSGIQYYDVELKLATPEGQILGTIDSNGVYKEARSLEYIDMKKADEMIKKYNLEKSANSSI